MRSILQISCTALACVLLWMLPGVRSVAGDDRLAVRGEVVEVDDSALALHGHVEFGTERLKVKLPNGKIYRADNELRAQMELDKKFVEGDSAVVIVPSDAGDDTVLVARDHWRQDWTVGLCVVFTVLLCIFGGVTGFKALMSFVFGCMAIWKLLIPLALAGYHASSVAFLTVAVLTFVIMYLVAGFTKKGISAFFGSMLGVMSSLALAHLFARTMHVSGATMPYAQTLLFSGYGFLDLQDVFIGSIVLASSGAVMDLGMDIAAGVCEVKRHNPSLGFGALFRSGVSIGRAVVGTMTTTLLLAYSGGYLTLLMMFAAQGTQPADFINSTLVCAEVVKTFVGSLGLVLVAPFTAFVSASMFAGGAD
ncbi:MAG: YibE/F family protein [Kiritimatiellae bacterium]|nr:YibE/F family protein [Kiritimatiellia bacterium]